MLPLPGLHVIDAVKVCLACGANVHRLVPVSESCCPLHMSARFLCLHYMNVQTSSHTMTTICRYTHQHACTLEKLGAPPHNNIPSCLQNQEKNQWSSDRDKEAWEEEQLKLFFFLFCLFPHFPPPADVSVKVDELLVLHVCQRRACWG